MPLKGQSDAVVVRSETEMYISRVCCPAELCGVIMALAGGAREKQSESGGLQLVTRSASKHLRGPSEQRAETLMHTNVYRYINIFCNSYDEHQ